MIKQKLPILLTLLGLFLPVLYASAGTVLSSHKYAWSNNVGYINFENVTVTNSALSGSAWSANAGWINMNPTKGGVLNDGTGNLSGSAWGESLGWIDFDGVSINTSTGKFSGTATGSLVGTITFNCTHCDVQTDWRPATPPTSSGGGGGGGGSGRTIPLIPLTTAATSSTSFLEIVKATPIGIAPYRVDIFVDGKIDILDFNAVIVGWGLQQGNPTDVSCSDKRPADINCDSVVNVLDFNLLMVNWGRTVSKK